ncbi:hypothetical protein ACFFX1_54630 [Dactylosporangium sucinum]|uniref:Uncharacterized protein n=1 Tax=Dactylosporangium sucinum TaxID=1424081 RepID=A0A917U2N0_9ACTN|nr:hypothetical protein [Dactylosporangium sucinum]GGM53864.1 hypothetical protein GCM10007977_064320 [Dactylosporangium sucinum]
MTTTARREPLTELDELTDQLDPLLARMAATLRAVDDDLAGRRRPVTTPCPTCGKPVPGLLVDSCSKPPCLAAAIAADVALDRRCDL